jgi:Tfp pilus assembly PilM family ATPase
MSRLITIECDATEVRVAVGSSGLTGVTIEKVLSGPIELAEGEEPWGTAAAINALRTLLHEAGIKSGDAIACVSRNDIELRAITLPDVDANELPDMVRFAAPRYFANFADNWPLDFITMPSHLEGSIDCVVGAINPTLVQKIERTASESGLHLTHMVLRPMAAVAGAMARHPEWLNGSVLFMDLLNEEADVVIAERGHAVFMRSFQAPGDGSDPSMAKMFSAEIKRTLLSAVSQRPGLQVDRIVLWSKDSMAPVAESLSQSLELPVTMLDPFAWAEKATVAIAATTQTVGRFAPVLGAFHFLQHRNRLIDFANPRKRIEKKKPIARYVAAAALGIATLAGGWWWHYSSHAALDNEIALLRETITNEAGTLKAANKHAADWKKIENFLRGDVRWLDELERLSMNAKGSEQAYFGTTTFMIEPRTNAASISAKYFAKLQDVVPDVQAAYRDSAHTVKGTAVTQSPDKNYPWASDLTIALAPGEVPDPRNVKKAALAVDAKKEEGAKPTESEASPASADASKSPETGEKQESPSNQEPVAEPPAITPAEPPAPSAKTESESVATGDAS